MNALSRSVTVLAVFAIVLSFFGFLASLGVLYPGTITGAATTGTGEVNITVPAAADISMLNNSVNFTGTLVGENKVSTNGSDLTSACVGPDGCGFGIKNDGTVFVNITSAESAIDPLFESPQYNTASHFTLNTSLGADLYGDMPYNSSVGYPRHTDYSTTESWAPVNYSACIVCQLNYTAEISGPYYWYDVAFVHVNVTVPEGEPAGAKGTTVTFTATDAGCGIWTCS